MRVQDFNQQGETSVPLISVAEGGVVPAELVGEVLQESRAADRQRTEVIYLKKRIEHLELVIETARSLMTSNQERLLRRLHDLPHELMVLSTALSRLNQDGEARSGAASGQSSDILPARKVA